MKPRSRQENIVVQDLQSETLIYDSKTDKAFCLNETAAFVWQNCDGEKSVRQIAEGLARKNRQPVNEDIVWLAIDQLAKDNLMADAGNLPESFAGMSRREVVKKVGLATMIALPLISGLVAPTAAQAQSQSTGNQGLNTTCTQNSQCSSGNCVTTNNGNVRCCVSQTNTVPRNQTIAASNSAQCDINASMQCCTGTATFTAGPPATCRCN